jgi:phosphohistidine phosphatase SixA
MNVYLLRHAEAAEAPRDEERELTEHGRAQAAAVAAGIRRLDLGITALLSSPLPRARQTAQPVSDALGLALETVDGLATGQRPAQGIALLAGRGDGLLLVGHEPQFSGIISTVTGGRVHLRKAMLAALECSSLDAMDGALAWMLSWRHLERLGRTKERKPLS